jgi:hypothetical protein
MAESSKHVRDVSRRHNGHREETIVEDSSRVLPAMLWDLGSQMEAQGNYLTVGN